MSPEEAQAFFSTFFGGSDPFGTGFGGGGRQSVHIGGGSPFGSARGGPDPISMMFGMPSMGGGMSGSMGGMPGGMGSMGGGMGGMPGASFGGMPGASFGQGMGGGGFGGSEPFGRPEPKRYDAIPNGTIVSLKGLVKATDRNGDRGVIKQYVPQTGRYIVELEDTDETMSVKAENLLQHVHVRLHDIQSKPELNGKTGTVLAWNSRTERYNIYIVALGKVLALKPGNVILDAGTVGQVTGLASKPQLNGKWGTVKGWIREANKYDVQLSEKQIIRIKVENVRV
jgi:hypothetical protein